MALGCMHEYPAAVSMTIVSVRSSFLLRTDAASLYTSAERRLATDLEAKD